MRVLLLTGSVPATPRAAGSPRSYHLIRGLAGRGHAVALVCVVADPARWDQFLKDDGAAQLLRTAYPLMRLPQPSLYGRIRTLVSTRPPFDTTWRDPRFHTDLRKLVFRAVDECKPDLMHVDQLSMAQYVPANWTGALVVDPHDAISLTESRMLALAPGAAQWWLKRYQASKIKNYEKEVARHASAYVVNSAPDLDYLRTFIPGDKLACIPNGVDTDYYAPLSAMSDEPNLVFIGDLAYPFNEDAALYFHSEILPYVRAQVPNVRLTLVGASPPNVIALAHRDPLTTVTGRVPDVRPYLRDASIFVCPLRSGTGMKNKLLNALAMAKPIVATSVSVDGIGVRDGEHFLRADGKSEFADAVCHLLRDNAYARQLGEAGRAFVEREHSCERFVERYLELYRRVRDTAELCGC